MCIIGYLIMAFIFMMKIYSMKNNVTKFTQSKFGKLLFKADWVNIHMVGGAKIIAIYFINFKYGHGCDPRILFICLTIFYGRLLVMYSNWVMDAVFNFQQGIFIIYEGIQNWNKSNYNNNCNSNIHSNGVGKADAIRFKKCYRGNSNRNGTKKIFNKPSYNINKNKINNIINSNIVVNNNLNGYAAGIVSNLVKIANKTTSIVVYELNNHNNYLSNIMKSAVINPNSNKSLIKFYSLSLKKNNSLIMNNNILDKLSSLLNGGRINKVSANINKNMIRGYATDSNLESNIEHGKKLQPHEKEMVKNIIGGVGYKSYSNIFEVGNVLELEKRSFLIERLGIFLNSLDPYFAHTALVVIRCVDSDDGTIFTRTLNKKSFRITHKNSPNILASTITILLQAFFEVYLIDPEDCTLYIMHRRWLDVSEFTTDLDSVAQTIDKDLAKDIYSKDRRKLEVQSKL